MINYPGFPSPNYVKNDGFNIAVYDMGPKDGPVIVLIHGWPELAYSWKTQMQPLADAGYRVIAYDLRGFGNSTAPKGAYHYGIAQMVSDVGAVISYSRADTVTLMGHDWGGLITWWAARMLQDRISHVISLCTPAVSRAPTNPLDIFRKRYGDEHYFVHFNERPGQADALFAANPSAFFDMMFRTTPAGSKLEPSHTHIPKNFAAYISGGMSALKGSILSRADKLVYVKAYQQSGFHGGLNLYRNTTENWVLRQELSDTIYQPSLMISARQDLFLLPEYTNPMVDFVPELERQIIEDCGHWMMWEQPGVLSAHLRDWLFRKNPA